MFIIKLTTKRGGTWFHGLKRQATSNSSAAHKFKNIGRAISVAKENYSKHVGKGLKGWHVGIEDKEIIKEMIDK